MTRETDKKQTISLSNIRNVNVANIIRSILKDKSKTRSELAKENDISVMTVKHIVDDLVAAGILEEKTISGGEVGRKPKALTFTGKYGNIVCVNLTSEQEISFLIYDIHESLLDEQVLESDPDCSYQGNLKAVIRVIQRKLDQLQMTTVGIAVFVPSAFYEDVDLVNYDLIPGFKDLHIRQLFLESFETGIVQILHDVIPAAWSEYEGMDPAAQSQFYFYCGHGVGGFFIHQGMAVTGRDLMAGEVGKMLVPFGDKANSYMTLEEIISVSSLDQKLKEAGSELRVEEVLKGYENQPEEIKSIIDPVLDTIAGTLFNLLWIYNPDALVIDSCYKEYSEQIAARFKEYKKSLDSEEIPISVEARTARYDEYHRMRGCFRMVREAWVNELAGGKAEV